MADIDVGAAAVGRSYGATLTNITYQLITNPANADGVLDTVEIYTGGVTGLKVGTGYGTGTSRQIRDSVTIGDITYSGKSTLSGLSIDVVTGDLISFYCNPGGLHFSNSGGNGIYYKTGDQFSAGVQTYTSAASIIISLYATGETVAVGSKALKRFGGIITETGFSKKVNLLILTETGWQKGI